MSLTSLRQVAALLLFLAFNCDAFSTIYPYPPRIVEQPLGQLLFQEGKPSAGAAHRLTCTAKGSPNPEFMWYKNGQEFVAEPPIDRVRQISPAHWFPIGAIEFTDFHKEDEGRYQCFAHNSFGIAISEKASVVRLVLHPFTDEGSTEVAAIEGQPLSLPCNPPLGFPKPDIDWIIQSNTSTFSDVDSIRLSVDPDGDLHFSNVTALDALSGTVYACSATSRSLHETKLGRKISISINDTSAPQKAHPITRQYSSPKETLVLLNTSLELTCIYGGTPMPEISWLRNGSNLHDDRVSYSNYGRTLKIARVDFGDEGVYECIASNGVHTPRSTHINVNVQVPPFWTHPPKNSIGFEGKSIFIACPAGGTPTPKVSWFRNGIRVQESHERIQMNDSSNTITIENLNQSDSAVFQCQARNMHGSILINFYLAVLSEKISSRSEVVTRNVGASATLDCHRSSENLTHLIWLFGDEVLEAENPFRTYNLENGSLQLAAVSTDDSGDYSCLVMMDEEWSIATKIKLSLLDIPDPPIITEVQCNSFTALVKWRDDHDGGSPILSYDLQMNTRFAPHVWKSVDSNIQYPNFTVPLSPWGNYTFRVSATNDVGSSAASATSGACRSPEDAPHKNPDEVRGRGTTRNNLVISWHVMSPIDQNAPGFFYKIYWRSFADESDQWSVHEIHDWERTKFVVPDQPSFEKYLIKVEAHNSKGPSIAEAPEIIGYSGENVPLESPRNLSCVAVLDSTTALLSWLPVNPESIRGHFKGYKVQAWLENEDQDSLWETVVSPYVNESSVQMFRPASTHRVRMLAFNDKYDGPPSEVVTVTTPEGTPGSVESFEAFPIGSSALALIWQPPLQTNGNLTGYRLYYSKTLGAAIGIMQEAEPPITDPAQVQAIIGDLSPNTKYRVTIRATTSVGEGQSYFLEARTNDLPHVAPDEPNFIYDWVNNMTEVKVTWTTIMGERSSGSYFAALYRIRGDIEWRTTGPVKHRNFVFISDLEPDSHYELKIVVSDANFSTSSTVLDLHTKTSSEETSLSSRKRSVETN